MNASRTLIHDNPTSRSMWRVLLRQVPVLGAIAWLLLAPSSTRMIESTLSAQTGDPCAGAVQPIVCENAKPGNPKSEWDLPGSFPQYGDASIQGFATDISINVGETVYFKVNTDATAYRVDIYRLGYYGGLGARKVATIQPDVALPQAQPGCLFTSATRLVDCGNWLESASWNVPADAVSGVYIAKLVREDGSSGVNHIIFVVRDDARTSDILVQTSDLTWQAYNRYGGYSLYYPSGSRAFKVSYNRPFITRDCCDETFFFSAEYPMLRWLEANGFDVSYFSGVDTARRGVLLQQHRVFMSSGHDEYWSGDQRTNIEAARAAGVHLAFFTGNEGFWKTRWESSTDGLATPFRTLVTYKETQANAKIDPSPLWTGTWRDPRFSPPADGGRPENALSGTLFMVNCCTAAVDTTYSITVPEPYGKLRLWRNTSVATLATGETAVFPAGTLGYEWDEDVDNGVRPPGLARLSATTKNVPALLLDYGNTFAAGTATHNLVLYRHSSGSLVFGAGTIRWAFGLDSTHDSQVSTADVRMQQATVNLLADMQVQPASLQVGLVTADPSTDTTPPTSVINPLPPGTVFVTQTNATITGSASDTGGGLVAGVEVSVDGGTTWHPASGWTPGSTTWSHTWMPSATGTVTLRSRAVDDSANIETPGAGLTVSIMSRTCPCSVWDNSVTPSVPAGSDATANELGLKFRTDTAGYVTGVRFYKGTTNTGTHVGHLWTRTGTLLATATFSGESATGWQQASFSAPVAVTAGQTYVVSYYAPNGHYAQSISYFATSGVNASPLFALATGVDGVNGVYKQGTSGFPSVAAYQSSNYWIDVVFAIQPPAAPTGLTATPLSSSDIYLTWNATPGAFSYRVERSADGGSSWAAIGTTTATSLNDSGLTAATTYLYRVIATSGGGDSAPSTVVSATTLVAPPAAPTGLTATIASSTQINLSWNASATATAYYVERAGADQGYWTRIATVSTTTYNDVGLPPATTFSYRVIATNAGGESAPSAVITAATVVGAPSSPSGLSATAISSTQISLSWNASAGATSYRLERSTNGGATWAPATTTTGATAFADMGLTAATTYAYRVIASNASGDSAPSATAAATTLPSTPSPPTGVTAAAAASTQVNVAWQASAGATSYTVQRSSDGGASWPTVGATSATSIVDTSVAAAATYSYRVVASNAGGSSAPSALATVTTPPLAPAGLTATAVSPTQVNLVWQAVAGAAGYQVERSTNGGTTWNMTGTATGAAFSDLNLTPATAYLYRVRATNAGGASAPSAPASATTPAFFQCPCSVWDNSVVPAVTASSDSTKTELGLKFRTDTAGYITGIRFYKGATNTGTHVGHLWSRTGTLLGTATFSSETASGWQQASLSAPVAVAAGQTYIVSYYAPNGRYAQNVSFFATSGVTHAPLTALAAGVDGANGVYKPGASGFPNQAGFQSSNYWVDVVYTTSVAPPSPPQNVTATAISSSRIDLMWTASSGATAYRVERSQDGSNWSAAGTTTAVTFSDAALQPDTLYSYHVVATNASGDSTPSATATATTLQAPPAAPTSLVATPVSSTQIDATWQTSVGATGYRLERSGDGGSTWTLAATTLGAASYSDTGLQPATTYAYRVFATNAAGDSPASPTTTASTPAGLPGTPTNVSATPLSSTQITVMWTASSSATAYRVEHSIDSGANWLAIGTTASTSLNDTGLTPDTSYQYRVVATNAIGESAPSATVTATTLVAPPAAPMGLSATPVSSTEIQLSWTASDGASDYRIERSINGGDSWTTAGRSATPAFHDAGLTANTTYAYRVIATNAGGDSAPSATASATTLVAPPNAPTGVTATAVSSSQIDVIWSASSGATGYRVEQSSNGGASWSPAATLTASPLHDIGLTASTTYTYRVIATNAGGDSLPSATASATTLVAPPAAPTSVTASVVSSTEISVGWAASSGATGYRVERSANGGASWSVVGTTATTSFNDTALTPETTYQYRIIATNAGGDSTPSTIASATTPPGAPGVPSGVAATAVSSTQIDVSWTASGGATGYRVERTADGGASWAVAGTTAATTLSDVGLTPATTYGYRVIATNTGGESAPSATANATTTVAPPPAPTGVTATAVSSTQIDVAWAAAAGATGYRVERSVNGGATWTPLVTTAAMAYQDTGLTSATTYAYRVIATNAGGDSVPSATASATTLSPPPAPSGLTATPVSPVQIDLAWQPSAGATAYDVERSLNGGGSWNTAGTSTTTSFSDTGLSGGTTYSYRVRATNAGGSSTPSGTATATTPVAPPSAPTGLVATPVSSTQINVTWQASVGATGYRIERSVNGGASWATAGTTGATTFDDTGLTAATTYTYRVVATNAGGESSPSATSSATTLVAPPSTPTGVTAGTVSATQIAVSWQSSSGATGYRVERSSNGGSSWTVAGTTSTLSFTDSGLSPATTYSYRVVATNAGGGSAPSTVVAATTTTTAPTGLTATPVSSTQINVAWQVTSGASGYRLQRSSDGGSSWVNASTTTSTAFSDTGLGPASTYFYRVFATNAGGDSAPSASVNATTLSAGQCPCTIWSASTIPAVASTSDTASNELGLKFRADTAGLVTGIRFYKGSTNTGTHVGHLWTRTGTLLGTVTFSGETASGWQQANFATPIQVTAGTTYIVSYYAPNGHYSQNVSYFATTGVTNSPLTALQNGVDGANGVYRNGSSGVPTSSYSSSNYWVDVVFVRQ